MPLRRHDNLGFTPLVAPGFRPVCVLVVKRRDNPGFTPLVSPPARRGPVSVLAVTRRHNPGFTLLELLVAMFIVALLTAGLAASMKVAFAARQNAGRGVELVRNARLALATLDRDFDSALPPTTTVTPTTLKGPFIGNSAAGGGIGGMGTSGTGTGSSTPGTGMPGLSTASNSTATNTTAVLVGMGDSVTFYNTADPTRNVDGASDIEQVTLALVNEADLQLPVPGAAAAPGAGVGTGTGTGDTFQGVPTGNNIGTTIAAQPCAPGTGCLVRRISRHLLAPITETPTDQVLCRNVHTFSLLYFDGTQWLDTWNSTSENNTLPQAVQVTVQLTPTDPVRPGATPPPDYTLTRLYRLPCAVLPLNNSGSTQ